MLDHIILGCSDLDGGVQFIAERTGVRAVLGGVHPGHGTRNSLLSVGGRSYLEVLAPDPQQPALTWYRMLPELSEPRLLGWAVQVANLAELAQRLGTARIACKTPTAGSRVRPDGRRLRWTMLALEDNRGGLLPFFLEWSADSTHPSEDAPAGCRLVGFGVESPDPDELAGMYQRLGVEVAVKRGDRPRIFARIAGPGGECDLTS